MKIYVHEGAGVYVGSVVVVCAKSRKTADKLIRKELDLFGLKDEQISIENINDLKTSSVIYSFNGDD